MSLRVPRNVSSYGPPCGRVEAAGQVCPLLVVQIAVALLASRLGDRSTRAHVQPRLDGECIDGRRNELFRACTACLVDTGAKSHRVDASQLGQERIVQDPGDRRSLADQSLMNEAEVSTLTDPCPHRLRQDTPHRFAQNPLAGMRLHTHLRRQSKPEFDQGPVEERVSHIEAFQQVMAAEPEWDRPHLLLHESGVLQPARTCVAIVGRRPDDVCRLGGGPANPGRQAGTWYKTPTEGGREEWEQGDRNSTRLN